MRANAILAEGSEFDLWVTDVTGVRIEIAQNHAGDLGEVTKKATAEVARYKAGQSEITVGIDIPAGEPVPSLDWIEGDELNVDGAWREVEALTCTLDDDTGRWVDVPQFGTVLDVPEQRIDRTLGALGGLNKGTSHLTRPPAQPAPPNIRP